MMKSKQYHPAACGPLCHMTQGMTDPPAEITQTLYADSHPNQLEGKTAVCRVPRAVGRSRPCQGASGPGPPRLSLPYYAGAADHPDYPAPRQAAAGGFPYRCAGCCLICNPGDAGIQQHKTKLLCYPKELGHIQVMLATALDSNSYDVAATKQQRKHCSPI